MTSVSVSDDDSGSDSDLELLHKKLVKIKEEINWDEEEKKYQKRRQKENISYDESAKSPEEPDLQSGYESSCSFKSGYDSEEQGGTRNCKRRLSDKQAKRHCFYAVFCCIKNHFHVFCCGVA